MREYLDGATLAVLVAFFVGFLSVLILFVTLRGTRSKEKEGGAGSESENIETADKEEQSRGSAATKQVHKLKKHVPAVKKSALPPHPLLATEFKGHTGAVLSLDFDTNGRYLASCSDGELKCATSYHGAVGDL